MLLLLVLILGENAEMVAASRDAVSLLLLLLLFGLFFEW